MRDVKKMTYKQLETELSKNRLEYDGATQERRRELCRRDADLMDEMDARWEKLGTWWKE